MRYGRQVFAGHGSMAEVLESSAARAGHERISLGSNRGGNSATAGRTASRTMHPATAQLAQMAGWRDNQFLLHGAGHAAICASGPQDTSARTGIDAAGSFQGSWRYHFQGLGCNRGGGSPSSLACRIG